MLEAFLRAARGATPEVGDLFLPFQRNYLQAVLASLLVSVAAGLLVALLLGLLN